MKKLLKKLIPNWLLSIYHFKLALLGALVYGFPSRKLKVIGVTGTKGKSTVVMLAGKVLENAKGDNSPQPPLNLRGEEITSPQPSPSKGEGEILPNPPFTKEGKTRVGWISSLTINDGKNEVMNPFHMTMPGRFFIQKTLARMVKNGCEYAIVEVTSEGIKQSRHQFIDWAGAVFTNLASEHLEAHGGFENYRAAKLKLFAAAAKNKDSFGVYNLDDENAEWFLGYSVGKKYGYGFLTSPPPSPSKGEGEIHPTPPFSKEGDTSLYKREVGRDFEALQISSAKLEATGSEFEIGGVKFKTKLLGEFNVYNCAAAVAVGQACGVNLEDASRALGKINVVPGRLEIINEGQDFTVVVDLAHTPDSFSQVFNLFKNLAAHRGLGEGGSRTKIISVFGSAGGGRDKWKRPELGRIASQYSDQLFITNEDPYDEDPLAIATEILAGCDKAKTDVILDRRQAIAKALSLAQAGDIILVLGKGTEQTYMEGNKKIHWDDRIIVREEIKKIIKTAL